MVDEVAVTGAKSAFSLVVVQWELWSWTYGFYTQSMCVYYMLYQSCKCNPVYVFYSVYVFLAWVLWVIPVVSKLVNSFIHMLWSCSFGSLPV